MEKVGLNGTTFWNCYVELVCGTIFWNGAKRAKRAKLNERSEMCGASEASIAPHVESD